MKLFNKQKLWFAFFCLLSIIIVMNYQKDNPLVDTIRSEILEIISPVMAKTSSAMYSIREFIIDCKNFFISFEENKKLKQRNDFLEYYFYRYKQIYEENAELRKELNATKEIFYPFTTAQIIARSNNYLHQEIIINAGSNNGIKKWQMVLAHNNLIGRIISVSSNTASVLLITDHDSRIPVISLTSKVKCIATGQITNDLICNYLNDDKPKENELAITSYDNPLIIPNIIVGTFLQKDGNFYIKPNIDISKIEFVQILHPSNV